MMKRPLTTVTSAAALLCAVVAVLYLTNATPIVPAISDREAAAPAKPYVIKLHAQWCPVCRATKGVWSDVETRYADRVNLVVFDFTNDETTAASRAEAKRLGLDAFFEENEGWTGTIAVVNGRTKETTAIIHGSRDFSEYRAGIDAALRQTRH